MQVTKKYTVLIKSNSLQDLIAVTGIFIIEDEYQTNCFRVLEAKNLSVEDGIVLEQAELEDVMNEVLEKYRSER